MKIEAVIFDMDGLLVDSEPLWQEAEIVAFAKVGLQLSHEECEKTTGLPTKDVVQYWFDHQPWQGISLAEVEQHIFDAVIDLLKNRATEMLGVTSALQFFKSKGMKIGLASASPLFLIEEVLEKLNVKHYFDFYHSAILEKRNKPAPDVYLTVAQKLGTPIENCLILEDSGNGVKGAVASGAVVCAVPAEYEWHHEKFDMADFKLRSLNEIDLLET